MADIGNNIKSSIQYVDSELNLVDSNLNSEDWKTRQITSIMMIIFFAMMAISYILFFNSFKKDDINITDSINFKTPLLFISSFSSLIMILIMSYSKNIDSNTSSSIIWALISLNIIIYFKILLSNSSYNDISSINGVSTINDFIKKNQIITNIINIFFYKKILFDQPFITYIYPFIIELFIVLAYLNSSNSIKLFIFGIISAFFMLDFLIEERYFPLINIIFTEDNNIINRYIFMICYLILLISILVLSFTLL